jgi:release factor glutamine methyltransferase
MDRAGLLARPELELEAGQLAAVEAAVGERISGRPLAYILGEKEFYSETFFVDERVLVPRPETEIVVEEVIKMIENNRHMTTLLDMGTGSGAIGVTVARLVGTAVVAVDRSPEALEVAAVNVRRHGVSERVALLCSDLFGAITAGARFSIIAANLPYVASHELAELMVDVRDYEPAAALDGGAGGMEVYERFACQAPSHTEPGGAVVAEVGGPGQAGTLGRMLGAQGFTWFVKKDLAGTERVVVAQWKSS